MFVVGQKNCFGTPDTTLPWEDNQGNRWSRCRQPCRGAEWIHSRDLTHLWKRKLIFSPNPKGRFLGCRRLAEPAQIRKLHDPAFKVNEEVRTMDSSANYSLRWLFWSRKLHARKHPWSFKKSIPKKWVESKQNLLRGCRKLKAQI